MAEGNAKNNKHNFCLDMVKGIACICVVFMHCEFPGKLGVVVQCMARFCVPFFFMVSGYFCYYENPQKKQPAKKIKHLLSIILGAAVFYCCFAVVQTTVGIDGADMPTLRGTLYFIFLNKPYIIAEQLWFLFALLYDYILWAIVDKYRLYKIAYRLIPVLMIAYIVFAQGAHLAGFSLINLVYRNFLIEGFPFFMLGHWIHENQHKIKINDQILILVIAGATLLSVAERWVMGRDFGVNICTFPQVIAAFLYCVNHPEKYAKHPLRILGTNGSMLVYVLHPFVWHTADYVYEKIGAAENMPALYARPVIVVCITIGLALTVNYVQQQLKNNRQKPRKAGTV